MQIEITPIKLQIGTHAQLNFSTFDLGTIRTRGSERTAAELAAYKKHRKEFARIIRKANKALKEQATPDTTTSSSESSTEISTSDNKVKEQGKKRKREMTQEDQPDLKFLWRKLEEEGPIRPGGWYED